MNFQIEQGMMKQALALGLKFTYSEKVSNLKEEHVVDVKGKNIPQKAVFNLKRLAIHKSLIHGWTELERIILEDLINYTNDTDPQYNAYTRLYYLTKYASEIGEQK